MRHALRPTSPDAANKISFVFFLRRRAAAPETAIGITK
jgi:hypothetical protein